MTLHKNLIFTQHLTNNQTCDLDGWELETLSHFQNLQNNQKSSQHLMNTQPWLAVVNL